jgi:hypothetical protein
MKATLLVVVLAVGLVAAGAVALNLWLEMEGVSLGFHGWLALGLGVALSLVVGVGLMALVFHSSRRGYDDLGDASSDPGRHDPDRSSGEDKSRR